MSNYLDVTKSVIISSPAGSGKTEKLARRYIALLKSGVDVERILAITFTDKAAAEMKQRILRILKEEDEDLFKRLLEKMSLMRVSTIHSFCGTLLRRFSFEASIDPNYKIEDAIDSSIGWEETLYEILMEAGGGKDGHELLLQTIGERGFRGLEQLKATITNLFEKTPFSLETEIPNLPESPSTSHDHTPLWKRGAEGNFKKGGLVDELKKWPGAKEAIEDYEKLFNEDVFYRLVSAEKYFLTESKMPRKRTPSYLKAIKDYQDWALKMFLYWRDKNIEEFTKRTVRIKEIFNKCFGKYSDKKSLKGILDFSDLEYIAYRLLTENPEWANILYAFDEKTDHILVDEFQDTNNFQWAVIDKLTEEWRSGVGAKREEGIKPTVFLVGDEKQSIYFFRGANVEVFHSARGKLRDWLKDEFYYEEVKENFRSQAAIINFTNHVFSKIMDANENAPPWVTRYSPFELCRADMQSKGKVELILLKDNEGGTAETRQREADIIAKRIQSLVRNFEITDRASSKQRYEPSVSYQRLCKYMDVALLLRKRTHLKRYEEAFRQHGIPFVAVKGIGFYQEPEVAMLRALVYFLSNPKDDYSLYILLKSPLFNIDESTIIKAINPVVSISNLSEEDSLFSKLQNLWSENPPHPNPLPLGEREHNASSPPLMGGDVGEGETAQIKKVVTLLKEWLSQIPYTPVSELIERALIQTKAWEYFYEAQRRANVKKFIRLIEDLEADGKSLLKIRDFLERTVSKTDEPKANVNTEGMDAVRIMTIHASKGLEFPIVFVPGIEEAFVSKTEESLIYEADGKLFLKYVPEPSIRKQDEDFSLHLRKEEEEQKRLLYVAVTRAEEALFLTGQWRENNKSFLGLLKEGLGLQSTEHRPVLSEVEGTQPTDHKQWEIPEKLDGFSILSEEEVKDLYEKAPKPKVPEAIPAPLEFIPLKIEKPPIWKAVTEVVDIRRQHGKDWVILGDIFHRLFESISKGVILEQETKAMAEKLLVPKGVVKGKKERFLSIIEKDISLLKKKGIWQKVILPQEDAYSELPFILEVEHKGNTQDSKLRTTRPSSPKSTNSIVYTGRIDRVIKDNGIYKVYDYKTFPVGEKEIEYLLKGYSFQLGIYKKAVRQLFKAKKVQSFIVFTHVGEIREVV
jgi:ATP-dependent helicase/nuclease subunit A